MAFFSKLGYVLAVSWGDSILADTNVLVNGSMNGFIAGKHYNTCKRLHPMLLSTSFRVLHFTRFVILGLPSWWTWDITFVCRICEAVWKAWVIDMDGPIWCYISIRGHVHGLVQLFLLCNRSCSTNNLNIDETHPVVREILEDGALFVRRKQTYVKIVQFQSCGPGCCFEVHRLR